MSPGPFVFRFSSSLIRNKLPGIYILKASTVFRFRQTRVNMHTCTHMQMQYARNPLCKHVHKRSLLLFLLLSLSCSLFPALSFSSHLSLSVSLSSTLKDRNSIGIPVFLYGFGLQSWSWKTKRWRSNSFNGDSDKYQSLFSLPLENGSARGRGAMESKAVSRNFLSWRTCLYLCA